MANKRPVTGLVATTKPRRSSIKKHETFIDALSNITTADGMGTRGVRCTIAGGKMCPARADGFEPDGYEADPDETSKCTGVPKKEEAEESECPK